MKERRLRKIEDEDWRILPGFNKRYRVSNYGRVKSFAYNKKDGKVLIGCEVNGFKLVQISKPGFSKKLYVHKLVAQVWGSKPDEKHTFVTHLDGNLRNNHISNLEWHTRESLVEKHRELAKQKMKDPRHKRIIRNSNLVESDIILLKSMLQRGVVQAKIAKMFCLSEMQITRIKRGENWGHVQVPKVEEEK
ncbi:MAG: hypothetical protein DRI89_06300 [Bacteroidetes bacterium]|nr:MAG: hypothetical protein DRI89_06300 [Bacteroidota bacterium]